MKRTLLAWVALIALAATSSAAFAATTAAQGKDEKDKKKDLWVGDTFGGLEFRGIGPALTSGRIVDIAVDPKDESVIYLAVACGGVWKTTNHGTTWSPIFDGESVYSAGVVIVDPNDSNIVWVGSGENNSQRSVSWGDGVYKSTDAGKSWKNVGLPKSEHIGEIVVDPRNSDVVYVAAQGPLWAPGGDRGLYKTTDGGATWKQSLAISENTGVSDVVMDPRNPDVLYATAYQRRRHVWTLINGGPESAIYKTRDGGANWTKLSNGLPKEEMGRIGLTIPPTAPDTIYATVEGARKSGGFFRSTDAGANWEKQSPKVANGPQYYQEIFADPKDADRVYMVDVFMQVTEDAGVTWNNLGEENKHVDNHAVWIDPEDTRHLLIGCDGGLYESYDRGKTWTYFPNLPITQFYRVTVDEAEPFYNVYGGTQDNFSLGGPSRTNNIHGIVNADWFVTNGGDGFYSQVDPTDPNIVYAESQHAGIVRFDRKTGEAVDIQPQPGLGEPALRWNWDSPLLISPHSHKRLYLAAQRLFRSDDRGDNWKPISPDLTRQLDRNLLPVMGKLWGIDTVAKNASTSLYGNIVALAESTLVEGLLYVGTDDGLVQVSEDGGANWRKIESFPGVPDRTYVVRLEADLVDSNVVYVSFDNHKMGDFKPYVLKSSDRGKTWVSIAGDLPATSPVYALEQDPAVPELMYAGTEFGVFFTRDGGKKWLPLKGGLPTVAIRDLVIQKREGDLVLASFGRGFYILDDLGPLRATKPETLEKEAELFPVRKAWIYNEAAPGGEPGPGFRGASFYTAPNPAFGASITYYLKESIESKAKQRAKREREEAKKADEAKKAEKDKAEKGKDAKAKKGDAAASGEVKHPYPTWDELRAEEAEPAPEVVLTVTDSKGAVVRRLTGPTSAGFHRVAWDLRYPKAEPISLLPENVGFFQIRGPLVAPGEYWVEVGKRVDGVYSKLAGPQKIEAQALGTPSLPAADRGQLLAFQTQVNELMRAGFGASNAKDEAKTRIDHLKKAVQVTPGADPKLFGELLALEARLKALEVELEGDATIARRNEPVPPSISDRIFQVAFGGGGSSAAPTGTHRENYRLAAAAFGPWLEKLRTLIETDLVGIEKRLEAVGAPWTPGRVPVWKP